MQLDVAQNRIVRSKPVKYSLIKGKSNSGKTTTAVYRALYLKNNYCLYKDDKILVLTKDSVSRDNFRNMYNKIEEDIKEDYRTLLGGNAETVEVLTILDIINRFYFKYTNNAKKLWKVVNEDIEVIRECAKLMRRKYGAAKVLSDKYLNFFKDEMAWIKSCGFEDLETYQKVDRVGRKPKKGEGPQRLLKNSTEREIMFDFYETYNKMLHEKGNIDYEDTYKLALKMALKGEHERYTHIIVDEAEDLCKVQVDFIKELLKSKTYSSIMFIINKSNDTNKTSWFMKGRKLRDLNLEGSIKSYNLFKIYKERPEGELELSKENKDGILMESYEYIDIKHHKKYDFKRDSGINDVIYVDYGDEEEVVNSDELRKLPVYSDIAAGEPILMHDEIEDEFYLPQYFLNGSKESFILKVRGDSMIGANIFDGDYVVIRRQSSAVNGDLVAVDIDGCATLKRLSLKNNIPVLMPENEKYDPIFIHDKEASIIGIVVGVIKDK